MRNIKKSSQLHDSKGFTIIEVLIVLAIAGLILLIVFLAVPALQRNSRNTSYRSEAAQLLSAASEHANNKNGAALVAADNATILGLTKNKNLTTLTVEAETGTTVPGSGTFNSAVLRTGAKCNSTNNETDAGSPRGLAILYNVENGSGGSTLVCTAS
jgi:prepilin-type N-terminal cleavage/methylation domain-containing protein